MPLPFAAGAAEIRARYVTASGLEAINVFHVMKADETPFDSSELTAAMAAVEGAWTGELAPQVSQMVFLADLVGTGLDAADGAQVRDAPNVPGEMTGGEAALLPFQTAACINWHTNTRGKSFRGKSFMVGFTEGQSAGGQVGVDVLAAVNSFAATLITDLALISTPLAIVSYYTGGNKHAVPPVVSAPRVTPIVTEVTSKSVDFNWKTQRRRALAG